VPIAAALLSWELFGSAGELATVIDEIQRLSAPPPVVVVSELAQEQAVPPGLAGRAAASFWLHADSPHFVADQVEWLVRTYALRSQVLGALAAGGTTAAGETTAGSTAGAGRAAAVIPAATAPAATAWAGRHAPGRHAARLRAGH
jgi:Orn/Lys/Arg decarboxylase, N-terminal domain